MGAIATMNVGFTYNQIMSLALQMPNDDQYKLYCALSRGLKTAPLREIREANKPYADEISMEDIVAECEAVRQERYEKQHGV